MDDLEKLGVDEWFLIHGNYVLNPSQTPTDGQVLDPYKIKDDFFRDLIRAAKEGATNGRQFRQIGLAEQVSDGCLPDIDTVMRVLTKPGREELKRSLTSAGFSPAYDLRRSMWEERLQETRDKIRRRERWVFPALWHYVSLLDPDYKDRIALERQEIASLERRIESRLSMTEEQALKLALRELLSRDMLAILEVDKNGNGRYKTFRTVFERYDPTVYDPMFFMLDEPPEYRLYVTGDHRELNEAAEISDGCIGGYMGVVGKYTKYPRYVNFILKKNGKIAGYVRMSILLTDHEQPVLRVDNLEVGRKDFSENTDSIKAMGLAAIQLGLDSNMRYVAGNEGRLNYGLKEAFGNKEVVYRARPINRVTFTRMRDKALMENWRRAA